MKAVKAQIIIEVWVECPVCEKSTDLTCQENSLFQGNKLPDPDVKSNETYFCDHCNEEFNVSEIEY